MSIWPTLVLYAAAAVALALGFRLLRRPLPAPVFVLFVAVPVALFPSEFFLGRTPVPTDHARQIEPWSRASAASRKRHHDDFVDDAATQLAPWNKAVRLAWKSGSFPWRNRWNGCGTPLAANPQSGAFSPWSLVALGLPLARALLLEIALQIFLSLCGGYLWFRELGVRVSAAVFGAITLALASGMTAWLLFPHVGVLALWPLALFLIEILRDPRAGGRALGALTLVVAAAALAGHPESLAIALSGTGLWLALRAASGDLPSARATIQRSAAAVLLGLGLTAFLLVPEVRAVRASNRLALLKTIAGAGEWNASGPGRTAASIVLPELSGDSIDAVPRTDAPAFPQISIAHPGTCAWPLLLLALLPGKRRHRRLPAVLIGGLGLALGLSVWPFSVVAQRLPLIGSIVGWQYLRWTWIATAAVATIEIDNVIAIAERSPRRAAASVATAAGLAGAIAALVIHLAKPALDPIGNPAALARELALPIELLLFLLVVGALAIARPRMARQLLPGALALAALLDLGARVGRQLPGESPADLYPPTPMTEFLARHAGAFRVAGADAVLFPNSNVFAGVEDVRTHDPLERSDYTRLLDAAAGYPPADYFKHLRNVDSRILDLLSVRYVASGPGAAPPGPRWSVAYAGRDGTVFENPDALPKVRPAVRLRLIARAASGFDDAFASFGLSPAALAGRVVTRGETLVLAGSALEFAAAAGPEPKISQLSESTNHVSFHSSLPRAPAGAIVVTSYVEDGGWSAKDETGRKLPTTRANGPFLALVVPGGDHAISLDYWPPGFWIGFWITAATLLSIAEIAAVRLRHRGRHPVAQGP